MSNPTDALNCANRSTEETHGLARNPGVSEPANRSADRNVGRSWQEWYQILIKAKAVWDKDHRRVV